MNRADERGLDDLLDASSPPTTPMDAEVLGELHRMQRAARPVPRSPRGRRRLRHAVAGVAALVLAGGAVTAAAVGGQWSPWALQPDASLSYTLPSGAECEQRIGGIQGTDPEVIALVEDFYRTTDVDELVTDDRIAAEIAQFRTEEQQVLDENGSLQDGGFGTEYYSADQEYQTAITRIIDSALSEHLRDHGVDGGESGLSWGAETYCPGADW